MKLFGLSLAACLLLISQAIAADVKDDESIKKLPSGQAEAAAYFEALMTADVEKANALAGVPFSLDRKKVLNSVEQVSEIHKEIAKKKGKRAVPEYTISKTDEAQKLDAEVFPKYVVFRVKLANDAIDIYVSVADSPKILGFSD